MPTLVPAVVFVTPRLMARPISPSDAPAMYQVYGDACAMRWVGDGTTLDLAQCENWIEVTKQNYLARGYGMFALVNRESGLVIGFCGLVHPGGQVDAELKYALSREFWGQGFASEAASAMLVAASSRFGLLRVIATIAPENIASHRVLLKAGMLCCGVLRDKNGSEVQYFVWSERNMGGNAG